MNLKHNDSIRKILDGIVLAVMIFSLCSGVSSPAFAHAQAATGSSSTSIASLTGWFSIIWGDSQDGLAGQQLYYLKSDDGTSSIQLRLDEGLAGSLGGVLGVNGKRVSVDGDWSVSAADSSETATFVVLSLSMADGTDIQDASSSQALTGSKPWVSILCKFNDVGGEPKNLAYFLGMYGSSFPGLDHYWREVSYNNINIVGSNAVGWYTLPHPRSYYVYNNGFDHNRAATDCTGVADPDVNFPQYVGINLMFNAELDGYAWGGGWYGTLDGVSKVWSTTWEPPWGYTNITVMSHEMGHGFGLPHSSGAYGQTYDNQWDVMSDGWSNCSNSTDVTYGCRGQHTIAYHKDILGWIPENQKFTPTQAGTTTITLEQLAVPQTSNYLMAQIPIGGSTGRFYTVEVRRETGYDRKLPGQAVIIHEVDTTRDIPAHVIDADNNGNTGDAGAMWMPGETFSDPANDISVSVLSATSTRFQVSITFNPSGDQTLTVTKSGTGSGTVTSSPSGIDCGSTCSYAFAYNTAVTLSAAPTAPDIFSGWSGAGCSGTGECSVTMSTVKNVTALFERVVPLMPSNLSISGATASSLTLTWEDNSDNESGFRIYRWGYDGANWTFVYLDQVGMNVSSYTQTGLDCGSNFNYYTVSAYNSYGESDQTSWVQGTTSACANLLNVTRAGTGSGTVTSSPAGIDCGSTCSHAFAYNTVVTLTATPATGSTFSGWSGGGCSGTGSCSVTMTTDTAVTADFVIVNLPDIPVMVAPAVNALVTDPTPMFDWTDATPNLDHYGIEIAAEAGFTSIVASDPALLASTYTPSTDLPSNSTLYWRVRSVDAHGLSRGWTAARTFRTALLPPFLSAPGDATHALSTKPAFDWSDVTGATSYTIQVSRNNTFTLLLVNVNPVASTYTPAVPLPVNLSLYWRVRTNGLRGPSTWSTVYSFQSANPPATPALLLPANNALTTNYTPRMDWGNSTVQAGTTFQKYELQLATNNTFTTPSSVDIAGLASNSEYTPGADLTSNSSYYWRVRAYNMAGEYSSWSLVRKFRTALVPPVLLLPADGENQPNKRPTFVWGDVAGATGYAIKIYRNSALTLVVGTYSVTPSTYTPAVDLPANMILYWRVQSRGANGPSAWSAARSIHTGNPPSTPTLLLPANHALSTDNTPRMDWGLVSLPVGVSFGHYQVQVADNAAFTAPVVDESGLTDRLVHETTLVTDLTASTKYYWRVRSYNAAGEYSAWSVVRTLRTAIAPPVLLTPANGVSTANRKPPFDWADMAGASGYTIQVSRNSTFTSMVVNKAVVLSAFIPTVDLPSGTLSWRVRANGINGPSLWSPTWSFTVVP